MVSSHRGSNLDHSNACTILVPSVEPPEITIIPEEPKEHDTITHLSTNDYRREEVKSIMREAELRYSQPSLIAVSSSNHDARPTSKGRIPIQDPQEPVRPVSCLNHPLVYYLSVRHIGRLLHAILHNL